MSAVEVHVYLGGATRRVGTLHSGDIRRRETVSFEYHDSWLRRSERFQIDPELPLVKGVFQADEELGTFGAFLDSTADSWGRNLLVQAEALRARAEGRRMGAVSETDFLLGVPDVSRQGALRFRTSGDGEFLAPQDEEVPGHQQLGLLMESARRFERNEEKEEDLDLMHSLGSALGGARPKASIIDQDGNLSVAKFPKAGDRYSVETWEHIAFVIAGRAGITVPRHRLLRVNGTPVFVSARFDRNGGRRIPFITAMTMLQSKAMDGGSYPEIADRLSAFGGRAREDAEELFRRMVLNIMISNVDDHLRNHGFLMSGSRGWVLSPAYDINPMSIPSHWRILVTHITPGIGGCSLGLALEQATHFGLHKDRACAVAGEVAKAVSDWRKVASDVGEKPDVIERMERAFEHGDLRDGLRLSRGPAKHRTARRGRIAAERRGNDDD